MSSHFTKMSSHFMKMNFMKMYHCLPLLPLKPFLLAVLLPENSVWFLLRSLFPSLPFQGVPSSAKLRSSSTCSASSDLISCHSPPHPPENHQHHSNHLGIISIFKHFHSFFSNGKIVIVHSSHSWI